MVLEKPGAPADTAAMMTIKFFNLGLNVRGSSLTGGLTNSRDLSKRTTLFSSVMVLNKVEYL